jgi:hypothetical protein
MVLQIMNLKLNKLQIHYLKPKQLHLHVFDNDNVLNVWGIDKYYVPKKLKKIYAIFTKTYAHRCFFSVFFQDYK